MLVFSHKQLIVCSRTTTFRGDSVGVRCSDVTNDDAKITVLLKVCYRTVARESVPWPPKRRVISIHPGLSITYVVWVGMVNALAQHRRTDRMSFCKLLETSIFFTIPKIRDDLVPEPCMACHNREFHLDDIIDVVHYTTAISFGFV